MSLPDRLTNKEIIKEIIKQELKNNLKVNTSIQFPDAFTNGYIKTDVFYGEDLIYSNQNKITKGSTMFSF